MSDTPTPAAPAPLDLDAFAGHTPGPWHYPGTGLRVGGPDRLCVIEYYTQGERQPDTRIANLTLAAAAPALLAECRRQRAEIEEFRRILRELLADPDKDFDNGGPIPAYALIVRRDCYDAARAALGVK